ncbi:DnaJ domain-containing protein [Multifurca ochricompacta]|uniref:DnaJ domain-containing protein n=1 Tax=Multifurca ochricompacta TaxID=376703 RepID=A0AAD4MB68_9AGAM|nr:DnaJ domain-containing protein [Multifurca ochricompacta]
MSTNLYEVLGVQRDATEDQIRKAYKKRALQTHPDRAPPEQKTTAEDEFRKVNNAYEVLIDTAKRRGTSYPFPDDPFDFAWNHHTGFTDPFRLFESIFGELHHAMSDPFFVDPWRRDRRHDVHQRVRGFFDDPLVGVGFPYERGNMFDDTLNTGNGRTRAYSQVSRGTVAPDGRWVAESRMTRTINGVTESVWKRRDGAGNEYATYTYPDGRERHTVNGREQIGSHQHAQPQRIQAPPPPPAPIQTSGVSPSSSYSATSRKRDSPTSASSRKRDSPSREHHSPIEIQSSSHAGSPPPINHHYRPPTAVHDRYSHETPHYKSRWWKR